MIQQHYDLGDRQLTFTHGGMRQRGFDGIGHPPGVRLPRPAIPEPAAPCCGIRELLGAGVAGTGLSVVFSSFGG